MTMQRAFSVLEVKAFDDEHRVIRGLATSPVPDRAGDVVVHTGARYAKTIPLFLYHDSRLVVGTVQLGAPTKEGIPFEATIPKVAESGALQSRVDEAWQMVKYKLIAAVSIGFRAIEGKVESLKSGGLKFLESEVLELSLVPIPMQSLATIQTIKSFDTQTRAALGLTRSAVVRLENPGVSGSGKEMPIAASVNQTQGRNMNTQETIAAFTAQRTTKAADMNAIMAKSAESGETLDTEQSEAYDTLKGEVETIDKHLGRLRDHEKSLGATATPVITTQTNPAEATKNASASRAGSDVIMVERKLPPGVAFARLAGAIAASKGSISDAERLVKSRFPDDHKLQNIMANMDRIKAAVDIGTTTDSDYASPLVQYQNLQNEFIEWLRPQTILGQMPNLRRVPFNISVPRQTSGGAAAWVGETAPKPVTQFAFDNVTLRFTKLASIAVISQELARFSSPSAEIVIRDSLAGALIQQMDSDFINPANAGAANVKPASITNGVTAIVSGGGTEADVRTDIQAVFAPFILANLSPVNGVWIMSATNALALSLMVNNLGQTAFPGITMSGGTFWGMPVIVSEAVGNIVVLANAADIMLADDGQVTVDSSSEASVQMDSAPANPTDATTVLVSLWQKNLLGIRAERYVNWVKARPASVQYLSAVAWGV